MKPTDERIADLNEWFYVASHGTLGVGWGKDTHPWGLFKSSQELHKKVEEIMDRPVWTSEMAESNQVNLVEELRTENKGFSFNKQMKGFAEAGKLIVLTIDENGQDLSKLKAKGFDAKPESSAK